MEDINLDNPTHEDIGKLIEHCTEGFSSVMNWREHVIQLVEEDLSPTDYPSVIDKFRTTLIDNIKDVTDMMGFMYATLMLSQFYYTGEEDFKKIAFSFISKEKVEAMLDDKPELFIVEDEVDGQ